MLWFFMVSSTDSRECTAIACICSSTPVPQLGDGVCHDGVLSSGEDQAAAQFVDPDPYVAPVYAEKGTRT